VVDVDSYDGSGGEEDELGTVEEEVMVMDEDWQGFVHRKP
jgi:hypothetical protein